MDCCKMVLLFINVIFMLAGIGILGAGIAFLVNFNPIKNALIDESAKTSFNLQNAGTALGVGVIVFGVAILLIASLGCLGACCENKCLLGFYAGIIIVILIAEIAVVIYAAVQGNKALDTIDNGLLNAMNGFREQNADDPKSIAISTIFQTFGCCGVHNYTDFTEKRINVYIAHRNLSNTQLPVECCRNLQDYDKVGPTFNYDKYKKCFDLVQDQYYREGCVTKLQDYVTMYKGAAIGTGVAIFIIEILTVIAAIVVCRAEKD